MHAKEATSPIINYFECHSFVPALINHHDMTILCQTAKQKDVKNIFIWGAKAYGCLQFKEGSLLRSLQWNLTPKLNFNSVNIH